MSKKYIRPKYLENKTRYIIELPFVQTSGAPGSIYEWNNGAHAAIHSILAGLMCEKKKDVHGWTSPKCQRAQPSSTHSWGLAARESPASALAAISSASNGMPHTTKPRATVSRTNWMARCYDAQRRNSRTGAEPVRWSKWLERPAPKINENTSCNPKRLGYYLTIERQ